MVFKNKYLCFLIFVLIVVFANAYEDDIQEMVEQFKDGQSDEEFRVRHIAALKSIAEVNKEANAADDIAKEENTGDAINIAREGFIKFIKCIAIAGDEAYNGIQDAGESSDLPINKQLVSEGVASAKKGVKIASIASYQGLGAAFEIAGNSVKQLIKRSIKIVIDAGQATHAGLDEVEKLAIAGLESGGAAKKQGLKSANEAVAATGSTTYAIMLNSSKLLFAGFDGTIIAEPQDDNNSMTIDVANESPEAWSAIEYINRIANATASELSRGPDVNALNLLQETFISAITAIAETTKQTLEAFKVAEEKANNGTKSAEGMILEASMKVKNDFAYVAAHVVQSLGAVAENIGSEILDGLEEAMSSVEAGYFAAYKTLNAATYFAVQGFKYGESSTETGLKAATDAILSAAYAFYAQLLTAANIAFKEINS